MYVYCVYPAVSQSPKQLSNILQRAETIVDLTFSMVTVAQHEGTRKALLGPLLNETEVYLTLLLVLKIPQLQDKG